MSEQPIENRPSKVPPFFTDAIAEVQRLSKFSRMADLGFLLGSRLSDLGSILESRLSNTPLQGEAEAMFKAYASELEEFAGAEARNGMAYLKRLTIVRLVTILESAVMDAVIQSIERVPEVSNREEIRKIKGPIVELLQAS